MTTVSTYRPRTRRNVELALLLLAVAIVVLAYVNVGLSVSGDFPPGLVGQTIGLLAISLAFHGLLRWRASYADPLLLPIVALVNALGLVWGQRVRRDFRLPHESLGAGRRQRDEDGGLAFRPLGVHRGQEGEVHGCVSVRSGTIEG